MAAAVGTVSSSCVLPPTLPANCEDYDAAVLIDMYCYVVAEDLPNSTTAAWGTTSSNHPIKVTFHAARPPVLSYLCVHCPDLVIKSKPKVIATDADLVLLRVPIDPTCTFDIRYWDYFLYNPHAHRLDLVPNPHPLSFDDTATALLSRRDYGGGGYAIAALSMRIPVYKGDRDDVLVRWDFDLHLYYGSDSDSKSKGRWTTRRMSLKEFVRDTLVPLPDDMDRLYHETEKTIVLGGERGTVAWVDLWRGLLFCNVLEKHPVLRDLPLPVPARGNWSRLDQECIPSCLRDITISRHRDCIKYVEMEIWQPRMVEPSSITYLEWVHGNYKSQVVPGSWKATTWTMAIPVGSFADWHRDCEVRNKDVTVDDASYYSDLLCKPSISSNTLLQELSFPTLSMDDDDVVYLFSRTEPSIVRKLELLAAIDFRKKILRGVAELDVGKDYIFMPSYCTSEICRFLRKSSCTKGEHKQIENEALKATKKEEDKPTEMHVKGPSSRKKYVKRVWRPVKLLDAPGDTSCRY